MWAAEQGRRWSGGVAGGEERGPDGPEGEWDVVDGALRGGAIEALFGGFQQYAPVDVGAEDAAGGAGHGFAFAETFAESALHLGGARGSCKRSRRPTASATVPKKG